MIKAGAAAVRPGAGYNKTGAAYEPLTLYLVKNIFKIS